jgi:hypothetical protein
MEEKPKLSETLVECLEAFDEIVEEFGYEKTYKMWSQVPGMYKAAIDLDS